LRGLLKDLNDSVRVVDVEEGCILNFKEREAEYDRQKASCSGVMFRRR